ncbi:hypothetical protein G6F56_012956 [Rhizopus delemar]|nr:hypothetical protein G6F56_012956 [Rhizopus delemar]
MFEYLSPMSSDPLAANSDASISLFDFNTFVSAPYSNDLITGGESLPPNTMFSGQSKYILTEEEYNALISFYDQVYPSRIFSNALDFDNFQFGSTIVAPEVYQFASIQLLGQTYTSKKSRTSHGSYIEIMVHPTCLNEKPKMKIGEVQYFFSNHLQNEPKVVADGGLYTSRIHKEHVCRVWSFIVYLFIVFHLS